MSWPASRYAWYVVGTLNLAYLIAWVDRMVISLLVTPIQASLGITDTQMGMLTGLAFGLCYTLFGLPAGYLADRWRRRDLLVAGMLLWSLATFLCGLASSFVWLFLARVAVGIGEAVLHPTSTSMIADLFPPERRAPAISTYTMAAAAASVVALLAGGPLVVWLTGLSELSVPLVGRLEPWQATFMIAGVPGLALAALLLFTVREPARRDVSAASGHAGASIQEAVRFVRENPGSVGALVFGQPFAMVSVYSLLAWLPVLFERTWGWSVARSAVTYALTAGLTSAIVSTLLTGYLVAFFRRRGRPDAVLLSCLTGAVGLNAFIIAACLAPGPELAVAFFAIGACFQMVPVATSMHAVTEIAPNRLRAKLTALLIFAVGIITNSLGPFAIGYLNDSVFGDPAQIRYSLLTLALIAGTLSVAILTAGLAPYRRSVAHASGGKAADAAESFACRITLSYDLQPGAAAAGAGRVLQQKRSKK